MIFQSKKMLLSLSLGLLVSIGLLFCQQVIQTQSHDTEEGIAVDLTSLEIQNNIVTLKFKLRNTGAEKRPSSFSSKTATSWMRSIRKNIMP